MFIIFMKIKLLFLTKVIILNKTTMKNGKIKIKINKFDNKTIFILQITKIFIKNIISNLYKENMQI